VSVMVSEDSKRLSDGFLGTRQEFLRVGATEGRRCYLYVEVC
jgi:hypothetical protein